MSAGLEHQRLDQLAEEIGTEIRLIDGKWRDILGHAITVGEKLIEAKGLVQRGHWRLWLKEHFPGSERTAQVYMQMARNPQLAADCPTMSEAIALLTVPKKEAKEKPPQPRTTRRVIMPGPQDLAHLPIEVEEPPEPDWQFVNVQITRPRQEIVDDELQRNGRRLRQLIEGGEINSAYLDRIAEGLTEQLGMVDRARNVTNAQAKDAA